MQHVMVDLETMGTGSYAAIVSIGAVKFYPDEPFDPATAESFYAVISLASAMKAGLRVDADTVMWWPRSSRRRARRSSLRAGRPRRGADRLLGMVRRG